MSSGVRFGWEFWELHSYVEWIILLTCPLQLFEYLIQNMKAINGYELYDTHPDNKYYCYYIIGVSYLSFGKAFAGWIATLKRGEIDRMFHFNKTIILHL